MMKHTFNISIAALTAMALSFLAAGCQKQDKFGLNGCDAPLSFSVGVVGEADFEQTGSDGWATKADNRKTPITEFKIRGYEGTERWFPNTDADQTVSTSSMAYNDYIWRSGTQHTFYAYANLPASSVATASIASDGVTLNYTAVPTSQASQQDILLGSYKGKGTNGKASIQFYHPLAAVAFKVGEISGVTKISSITLDGAYKSGSVKLSETSGTPAFAWTASETQNGVNQNSLNVTTFTTNTAIGDPFILIPQTFSSKPLTVKIALTTAEGDKTVTATLSTGSIAAGKTTTYAINYDGGKGLNFSTPVVTAWGNTGDPVELALEEEQEPEYWVDLGFVSKNGKKLLFSTRNVKAIVDDPSTGGKKAIWADSDTDPGNAIGSTGIPTTLPATLTSEDGKTCMPLSSTEIIGLLLSDNISSYTLNDSSNPSYYTATSAITGNTVNFPLGTYWSSVLAAIYGNGDDGGYFSRNIIFSSDKIKGSYSGIPQFYSGSMDVDDLFNGQLVRLVCESEEEFGYGETCELYYSLTKHEEWDADNFKYGSFPGKLVKYSSSLTLSSSGDRLYIFLKLPISNGYTMLTEEYLPSSKVTYQLSLPHSYVKRGQPAMGVWTEGGLFEGSGSFGIGFNDCGKTYTLGFSYSCFIKGTLITLADGSRKPVEEITYDDKLKVWNFDKGCYDSAKPFWITKAGQTTEQYYRMTFSDGTVLNILGPQYKSGHKLYNYTDRKFEGVKTLEVGKEVYTENGVVTLVSKEEVNEEVEFYCLMTEDHLNCFAEGVLASLRYNNIYPFDENMKFVKDGRSRRPYKEFKAVGISREWYNGLRLGEQTDDLDTIKKYVDRYDAQTREKPAPSLWQRLRTWWKSIFG